MTVGEKVLEKVLKALANKKRIAIVRYVRRKKEAVVGEIADEIKLSFKATSRHLGRLSAVDILEREQRGPQAIYRISSELSQQTQKILSLI